MKRTEPNYSNLQVTIWILYGLSALLLSMLLFFAFIFSQGRELWGLNAFTADTVGGYWYGAAMILTVICFFGGFFVRSDARRRLVATTFTIGIILTAIIGPTYIAGGSLGQSWLSFYTPIPWFIVWVTIVTMWLFMKSGHKPASSIPKNQRSQSRR